MTKINSINNSIPGAVGVTTGSPNLATIDSVTGAIGDSAASYSKGTFTPGIAFGGGTTGITYAVQSGNYTKIGNVVNFTMQVVTSSIGSSTGNMTITGLPFAFGPTGSINLMPTANSSFVLPANYYNILAAGIASTTTMGLYATAVNGSGSDGLDQTYCSANIELAITGLYIII